MARNSTGTYSLPAPMAVSGAVNSSATVNGIMNDIATEVSDSLSRSGKGGMSTALNMGGFKVTNSAPGAAPGDLSSVSQAQSGAFSHAATVGGTVDAITITMSPATTSWVSGERFRWTSAGANTSTTPTISKDSLSAKTIKKGAGDALAAGDIGAAGSIMEAVYNGTDVILLNPSMSSVPPHTQLLASITDAGTAAALNYGTGAGQVVVLDGSAKLPAVDGSALTNLPSTGVSSVVNSLLTASGTWTKPADLIGIDVELKGGGSGGNAGGGGGEGGVARKWYAAADLSATEAFTIGAGSSGASSGTVSAAGGSTFKGLSAGGAPSHVASVPGSGGSATGGDINLRGMAGGYGNNGSGGGYGGGTSAVAAQANSGGGGGGGTTSTVGGSGAGGYLLVTEYYSA